MEIYVNMYQMPFKAIACLLLLVKKCFSTKSFTIFIKYFIIFHSFAAALCYQKLHWFSEREFISSNVSDYWIKASSILFICWLLVMRYPLILNWIHTKMKIYILCKYKIVRGTGLKTKNEKEMVVPIICDEQPFQQPEPFWSLLKYFIRLFHIGNM